MSVFRPTHFCAELLVSGAILAQTPAKPAELPYSETTAGMVEQSIKDRKDANARLNSVYNQLLSHLDDGGKEKLRVAEKAWLKYRDAQIEFEDSLYEGGSIKPLMEGTWMVSMTKNRTEELQQILNDEFGH